MQICGGVRFDDTSNRTFFVTLADGDTNLSKAFKIYVTGTEKTRNQLN
jgi:hypothetical protein